MMADDLEVTEDPLGNFFNFRFMETPSFGDFRVSQSPESEAPLLDLTTQAPSSFPDTENEGGSQFYPFLSLLFPIGLALYRSGLVERKNAMSVIISPFIHYSIGCLTYWFIGYGFANGGSDHGFIGTKYFVPRAHLYSNGYNISLNNWFAQYSIMVSCISIAACGLPESSYLINQFIVSFLVAGFAFPVVAHWTYHPQGWLQINTYADYGGAGMLYVVGGSCALTLCLLGRMRQVRTLEPQRKVSLGNRYLSAANQDASKFFSSLQDVLAASKVLAPGHNLVLSTIGTFISLLGFFPLQLVFLNFGEFVDWRYDPNLEMESTTEIIILNSFLASSAGALISTLISRGLTRQWSICRFFGGGIAGLVCASSGLDVYLSWASLILGFSGGIFYLLFRNAAIKLRIQDPVETISAIFVPGILSVLARGVASGTFQNDPKIFLWQWAGLTSIIAWSCSIILVVYFPIVVCFNHAVFVQQTSEQIEDGLDKIYMREIVIDHICKGTGKASATSSGQPKKERQTLAVDVSKSRSVTETPEPSPVPVAPLPTKLPPNYNTKKGRGHLEITSPVLISTTATLPTNFLQNINTVQCKKSEARTATKQSRMSNSLESIPEDEYESNMKPIQVSTPSSPRDQQDYETPVRSQTLPAPIGISLANARMEKQRRPGVVSEVPIDLKPGSGKKMSTEKRLTRQKISMVDDDYTSGADSDTNNNGKMI